MAKRLRRLKRRDLKRAAILLAVVLVVGAIALFVKAYQNTSPNPPPVAGIDSTGTPGATSGSSGTGGPGAPGPSPSSTSALIGGFPTQLTSKLGHDFSNEPGHKVVLTATSSGTIARLGWLVPTADSNQYGDQKGIPRFWSMTFTARGTTGPYGGIFIQTDKTGTPVHCTVSVDGVTKDSQTVSGQFKQGFCYG